MQRWHKGLYKKSENIDSIDSSILKNINNKSINYLKYNNDDIYEKNLFKNKINNAKKEYIKLKNEIIILKKKKKKNLRELILLIKYLIIINQIKKMKKIMII